MIDTNRTTAAPDGATPTTAAGSSTTFCPAWCQVHTATDLGWLVHWRWSETEGDEAVDVSQTLNRAGRAHPDEPVPTVWIHGREFPLEQAQALAASLTAALAVVA